MQSFRKLCKARAATARQEEGCALLCPSADMTGILHGRKVTLQKVTVLCVRACVSGASLLKVHEPFAFLKLGCVLALEIFCTITFLVKWKSLIKKHFSLSFQYLFYRY